MLGSVVSKKEVMKALCSKIRQINLKADILQLNESFTVAFQANVYQFCALSLVIYIHGKKSLPLVLL